MTIKLTQSVQVSWIVKPFLLYLKDWNEYDDCSRRSRKFCHHDMPLRMTNGSSPGLRMGSQQPSWARHGSGESHWAVSRQRAGAEAQGWRSRRERGQQSADCTVWPDGPWCCQPSLDRAAEHSARPEAGVCLHGTAPPRLGPSTTKG